MKCDRCGKEVEYTAKEYGEGGAGGKEYCYACWCEVMEKRRKEYIGNRDKDKAI